MYVPCTERTRHRLCTSILEPYRCTPHVHTYTNCDVPRTVLRTSTSHSADSQSHRVAVVVCHGMPRNATKCHEMPIVILFINNYHPRTCLDWVIVTFLSLVVRPTRPFLIQIWAPPGWPTHQEQVRSIFCYRMHSKSIAYPPLDITRALPACPLSSFSFIIHFS